MKNDPKHIVEGYGCNESIREQTCQEKLELSVQESRIRWLGHVQRISDDRIAKQVLHWIPEERKKRSWPRITCQHVISRRCEGSNVVRALSFLIGCRRKRVEELYCPTRSS